MGWRWIGGEGVGRLSVTVIFVCLLLRYKIAGKEAVQKNGSFSDGKKKKVIDWRKRREKRVKIGAVNNRNETGRICSNFWGRNNKNRKKKVKKKREDQQLQVGSLLVSLSYGSYSIVIVIFVIAIINTITKSPIIIIDVVVVVVIIIIIIIFITIRTTVNFKL